MRKFAAIAFSLIAGGCLFFVDQPDLEIPDQTVAVGATLTLDLRDYVRDAGSDDLEFGFVSPEENDYVGTIAGGIYTFTPTAEQTGDHSVSIYCTNGLKDSRSTFTVTVTETAAS